MDESKIPSVDKPKQKRNLKDRVPVNGSTRNILSVQYQDPNYKYRWVINDPDRVAKFRDGWWEPDDDERNLKVGDRKVDTSAGTSSIVETKAGMGRKYILMKLPKELWEADQKAKHDEIDRVEAEMLREAKNDRYGNVVVDRSGKADPYATPGS